MPGRDTKEPRGKPAVVVSIADAARDLARQKRRRDDPPAREPRGPEPGVWAGKWTPNNLGLPSNEGCECPVIPLGHDDQNYYLIDASGVFRAYTASDFSHAGIQSLFAATPNYPDWAWPRYGRAPATPEGEKPKPPPIKSFEDDAVRRALFLACARKGLFSPTDKLRGRGAWLLRGGQIVYHAGEELWTWDAAKGRPAALDTGLLEGHLYPRQPALPSPWSEAIKPADNPAGKLLETLRRWHWDRPDIDPLLVLGWIGVGFLGGALRWRSAVLLIGDKGTGKSTLQEGLRDLFGDALFHAADTTAAGIYQKMAHDARPVAVDELEPSASPAKVDNVVTLMRAASSGAIARRGGQSGDPTEYQMRSAFLFSAINNPLHEAADFSRVAILRLKPLDPHQARPDPIDADTCGRKLLAILMREWHRFETTLQVYKEALAGGGHDARGQDTYGTLLAAADLMLADVAADHDVRLTEDLQWWSEHLAAEKLPEVEDAKANWRACLEHLLTAQVEAWRNGARQSIGKCLDDLVTGEPNQAGGAVSYAFSDCKRDLALTGIGLLTATELLGSYVKTRACALPAARQALGLVEADGHVIAIPNASPIVAKLFKDKPWGAGGWKDALRQCPVAGVMISDKDVNRVNIAGVQARCTLVVVSRFHGAPER